MVVVVWILTEITDGNNNIVDMIAPNVMKTWNQRINGW